MFTGNKSPCDINAQLPIKEPWKHHTPILFLLGIIISARSPRLDWYANPGRTILSETLQPLPYLAGSQRFDELDVAPIR